MYHYSFVRLNMRKKFNSVSNKSNYANTEDFLAKFENYDISHGVIHPHPLIGQLFLEMRISPNYFEIDLDSMCNLCIFGRCVCNKK